jgi:putative transposase
MSHSHVSVPVHFIFSTKDRLHLITPEIELRLWGYLAGTARGYGMFVHAAGGYENHVHVLADLPATRSISQVMQYLKQASSRWMNDEMPNNSFSWQPGYGAFGVGRPAVARTIRYIENQREHHRIRTYQEELLSFLEYHGIPYDPRYIWK